MDYYKVNFRLMEKHKYSLTELDSLLPWERDIYVNLLIQDLQKESEEQ